MVQMVWVEGRSRSLKGPSRVWLAWQTMAYDLAHVSNSGVCGHRDRRANYPCITAQGCRSYIIRIASAHCDHELHLRAGPGLRANCASPPQPDELEERRSPEGLSSAVTLNAPPPSRERYLTIWLGAPSEWLTLRQ